MTDSRIVGSAPPFAVWVQVLIAGVGLLLLFWPRRPRGQDDSRREAAPAGGAAPPTAAEQPGPADARPAAYDLGSDGKLVIRAEDGTLEVLESGTPGYAERLADLRRRLG